ADLRAKLRAIIERTGKLVSTKIGDDGREAKTPKEVPEPKASEERKSADKANHSPGSQETAEITTAATANAGPPGAAVGSEPPGTLPSSDAAPQTTAQTLPQVGAVPDFAAANGSAAASEPSVGAEPATNSPVSAGTEAPASPAA